MNSIGSITDYSNIYAGYQTIGSSPTSKVYDGSQNQMGMTSPAGSSSQASTVTDADGDNDLSATQTGSLESNQNIINNLFQTAQDQSRISLFDSNTNFANDTGNLLFGNNLMSFNSPFSGMQSGFATLFQALAGQQQFGGLINNDFQSSSLQVFFKKLQQDIAIVQGVQATGSLMDMMV